MEQGESDLDALPAKFILDLCERLRTEVWRYSAVRVQQGYKGEKRRQHRAGSG